MSGLDLRDELLDGIRHAIDNHPRSLQTRIGPSEVGVECDRRIAHKLLGTPERKRSAPWRPTVGTAVHAWLEAAFLAENERLGRDRYLVETTVTVGVVNGVPLTGSADLYDTDHEVVVDWKIVGTASLRSKRSNGPGATYETQLALYGKGFADLGRPVQSVAICFLPSAGELSEAVWWSQPYDEGLALAALVRLARIDTAVRGLGERALPLLSTHDSFCRFCPWLDESRGPDNVHGCPGHDGRDTRVDPITTLIA